MKVGEIWRMKTSFYERIRQDFIEMYGDDNDFDKDAHPRVIIISLKDDYVEHETLDGMSNYEEPVKHFIEEYEKDYNESR